MTGLSLVGEIQVAVRSEHEIVDTLEPLQLRTIQDSRHAPRRGFEQHDSVSMIGDEHPSILVELEPVRLAVVLGDERHRCIGRDPEDPAPGNVDDPQVSFAVERRSFEEERCRRSVELDVNPRRATIRHPVAVRNAGEYFCLDDGGRVEHPRSWSMVCNIRSRCGCLAADRGSVAVVIRCRSSRYRGGAEEDFWRVSTFQP